MNDKLFDNNTFFNFGLFSILLKENVMKITFLIGESIWEIFATMTEIECSWNFNFIWTTLNAFVDEQVAYEAATKRSLDVIYIWCWHLWSPNCKNNSWIWKIFKSSLIFKLCFWNTLRIKIMRPSMSYLICLKLAGR